MARAECRSIPHQIEFWAKIGKCALDNPDLPEVFEAYTENKTPATYRIF